MGHYSGVTHSDALLDEVVLINLELCLQACCLCLVGSFGVGDPVEVEVGLGVRWGDRTEAGNCVTISLDVFARLCFGRRSFECINTQGLGGLADEEESIESGAAYTDIISKANWDSETTHKAAHLCSSGCRAQYRASACLKVHSSVTISSSSSSQAATVGAWKRGPNDATL